MVPTSCLPDYFGTRGTSNKFAKVIFSVACNDEVEECAKGAPHSHECEHLGNYSDCSDFRFSKWMCIDECHSNLLGVVTSKTDFLSVHKDKFHSIAFGVAVQDSSPVVMIVLHLRTGLSSCHLNGSGLKLDGLIQRDKKSTAKHYKEIKQQAGDRDEWRRMFCCGEFLDGFVTNRMQRCDACRREGTTHGGCVALEACHRLDLGLANLLLRDCDITVADFELLKKALRSKENIEMKSHKWNSDDWLGEAIIGQLLIDPSVDALVRTYLPKMGVSFPSWYVVDCTNDKIRQYMAFMSACKKKIEEKKEEEERSHYLCGKSAEVAERLLFPRLQTLVVSARKAIDAVYFHTKSDGTPHMAYRENFILVPDKVTNYVERHHVNGSPPRQVPTWRPEDANRQAHTSAHAPPRPMIPISFVPLHRNNANEQLKAPQPLSENRL